MTDTHAGMSDRLPELTLDAFLKDDRSDDANFYARPIRPPHRRGGNAGAHRLLPSHPAGRRRAAGFICLHRVRGR